MVQLEELARIRAQWMNRGSHPCAHERVEQETQDDTATGDFGCLDCGQTWWREPPPTP